MNRSESRSFERRVDEEWFGFDGVRFLEYLKGVDCLKDIYFGDEWTPNSFCSKFSLYKDDDGDVCISFSIGYSDLSSEQFKALEGAALVGGRGRFVLCDKKTTISIYDVSGYEVELKACIVLSPIMVKGGSYV